MRRDDPGWRNGGRAGRDHRQQRLRHPVGAAADAGERQEAGAAVPRTTPPRDHAGRRAGLEHLVKLASDLPITRSMRTSRRLCACVRCGVSLRARPEPGRTRTAPRARPPGRGVPAPSLRLPRLQPVQGLARRVWIGTTAGPAYVEGLATHEFPAPGRGGDAEGPEHHRNAGWQPVVRHRGRRPLAVPRRPVDPLLEGTRRRG